MNRAALCRADEGDIGLLVTSPYKRFLKAVVVHEAIVWGFDPPPPERFTESAWDWILSDVRRLTEYLEKASLEQEATDWMNEHQSVPGAQWGFREEGWGLWKVEETE